MNFYDADFLDGIKDLLPPIFSRETASKMIGGIFSPKTLSNFDAAGKRPKKKIKIGKRVAYEKDDFVAWLQGVIGMENNHRANNRPQRFAW